MYNLVVDKNEAKVVEGDTNRVDLVLKMKAADFNNMIYMQATGEATESAFIKMGIAKRLMFAGDMTILKDLFSKKAEDKK